MGSDAGLIGVFSSCANTNIDINLSSLDVNSGYQSLLEEKCQMLISDGFINVILIVSRMKSEAERRRVQN